MKSVTVITVNFKTPKLVRECVNSFLTHYPATPYVLIDNGGCEASKVCVKDLARTYPHIQLLLNERNAGHGPALNQGLRLCKTDYVFVLDSDTRVEHGGFLELMLEGFEADPQLFAAGWLRQVTLRGDPHNGCAYVHPHAALLDRAKLSTLRDFEYSGLPSAPMMAMAVERGFHLKSFPVEDYIWHKMAGTRGLFRGQYKNIPTDREPGPWRYHKI